MPTVSPVTSQETELARLETEIRSSVQRQNFAGTEKLFVQYCGVIEQCVRTAPHPQAMCQSLSVRMQNLFEWARRMTLLSRGQYQEKLVALHDASRYLAAHVACVAEPRFRVKG